MDFETEKNGHMSRTVHSFSNCVLSCCARSPLSLSLYIRKDPMMSSCPLGRSTVRVRLAFSALSNSDDIDDDSGKSLNVPSANADEFGSEFEV